MDAHSIEPAEQVSASKKLGRDTARELAKAATKLIVCKGKKVTEFKPAGKPTTEQIGAMLGPTGNLRAPTLRVGKTVIVGYNDDVFAKQLG